MIRLCVCLIVVVVAVVVSFRPGNVDRKQLLDYFLISRMTNLLKPLHVLFRHQTANTRNEKKNVVIVFVVVDFHERA